MHTRVSSRSSELSTLTYSNFIQIKVLVPFEDILRLITRVPSKAETRSKRRLTRLDVLSRLMPHTTNFSLLSIYHESTNPIRKSLIRFGVQWGTTPTVSSGGRRRAKNERPYVAGTGGGSRCFLSFGR